MSAAYLLVSAQLLRNALKLPDDCEIIADGGVVRLLVDHPSIPNDAREVSAMFTVNQEGLDRITTFLGFTVVARYAAKCAHCDGSGKAGE